MGGVITELGDVFSGNRLSEKKAHLAQDAQQQQWQDNLALWERQFGSVSDALKNQMAGILGVAPMPAESPWQKQYKDMMRQEIDSGIRPGEEAAREALRAKVAANPTAMSAQSYAKGLGNLVKEGSAARGSAYRQGMSAAELTPVNLGLSFMGRTPFQPQSQYMPNYTANPSDPAWARMMGGGLSDVIKGGKNLYNDIFGSRTGGLETFGGNYYGGTSPGYAGDVASGLTEYGWD